MIPKPPVKYTDMAIYIDNHVYTEDCDDEKVFIYLYHLALMLAHQNKLFKRPEYYKDFALTFAEDIYLRLRNPKQGMLKGDGTPKMPRVSSVLNYMKKTLYGRKVTFEQERYSQSFSINQKLVGDVKTTHFSVINQINYYRQGFSEVELGVCLSSVCRTVREFLKRSPYYNNKKEWYNIYISCLLTILNSFILSKKDQRLVDNIKKNSYHKEDNKLHEIESVYKKSTNREVLLYQLEDNMRDYIAILCRRIKSYLSITFKISSYDTCINEDDLIRTTIDEMGNNSLLELYE